MSKRIWTGLIMSALCIAGCGGSYNGQNCDLGTGTITQQVCDQAAAASSCSTHSIEQHPTSNPCQGGPQTTETCCDYTGCSSQPNFPSPTPNCT